MLLLKVLHLLGDVTAKPGLEVRSQIFTFARESDNGTQIVAAVAGVIAAALEDHAVHRAADLLVRRELLEGVGELDLAAAARLGLAQYVEDGGVEYVAPDDRVVRRGVGDVGLLDQVGDLDDVAVLGGVDGGAAVEVDLLGATSMRATTLPPCLSWISTMRARSGSRGSIRSSPRSTANGSLPTCGAAHRTA